LDKISVDIPRSGQFLNTRPRKPRRNNSGRNSRKKNPLKSGVQGETTYTEIRTNVGEVMSGKFFANSALAGLAAKEDITNVRLRSASTPFFIGRTHFWDYGHFSVSKLIFTL